MTLFRIAASAALALLLAGPALAQGAAPATGSPPRASAPAAPAAPAAPEQARRAPLVDINSATAEELDALPGIGAARAAAIIKGRPYKGKDELVRKKVIPQGVYNGIRDRIVARQS